MNPESQRFVEKWSPAILKHGFTMIPNVLLDNVYGMGITASQLGVLLILERYRWLRDEEVFPSYKTIGKQSGQSERTVERCIEQLKKDELLLVTPRVGKSSLYDTTPLIELLNEIAQSEDRPRHSGATYPRHFGVPP